MFRLTLSRMLAPGVEDGAILVYDKETDTFKGTRIVIRENKEGGEDEVSFPTKMITLEGTPLGGNQTEYVVYDNESEKMIYSNIPVTEKEMIEGTPLGGDKLEYLAYDNSVEKIRYSNKEINSGDKKKETIFFYTVLQNDLVGIEFNPIIFNNVLENTHNLYRNPYIVFPEKGIYRIEVTIDCIVLSSIDLPLDITTSITRIRNNLELKLAEKIYSLNQIGETKFIKTEVLLPFEQADKVHVSVMTRAIDKGVTIKKSSSLICYKYS